MEHLHELNILLAKLKTRKWTIEMVANKIGYRAGYIRSEKIKPDPSPHIAEAIKDKLGDVLKEIDKAANPSKAPLPYPIDDSDASHLAVHEGEAQYTILKTLLDEKEARRREAEERAVRAEAEIVRLLAIIEDLSQTIRQSQQL